MTVPLIWHIDTNVVSAIMQLRPEACNGALLGPIALDGLGRASITAWDIVGRIDRLAPSRTRRNA